MSPTIQDPRSSKLPSRVEDLLDTPKPELLGTLSPAALASLEVPSPPWEVDPRYNRHDTDARRFVTVPDNWTLRWLSEPMIQQVGMRDWQAISAADPRIRIHNTGMVAPDNTIRRGDHRHGDILCWMYTAWVESRARLKASKVARRAGTAVDRQAAVVEEVRRGSFGRYISVDNAVHPTHTQGDGRSMSDPA